MMEERRAHRRSLHDGLDDPGKVIVDEIPIYLLQAGEDISAGEDEPRIVQRVFLTDDVAAAPGVQCERDEEKAVKKDPGLPACLVHEAERADDDEERSNEALRFPCDDDPRGKNEERGE